MSGQIVCFYGDHTLPRTLGLLQHVLWQPILDGLNGHIMIEIAMNPLRSVLFPLAFLAFNSTINAEALKDVKVEMVEDFQALGEVSVEKRLPILLMFSASHCTYCVRLEEEFLKPMLRSGDYDDKVLIRKIRIDSYGDIHDFDGQRISVEDFSDRYNVYVTPTVAFLDGSGKQLAPKRVGLSTPEFYGGYLDQAIELALDMLNRNKPLRVKLSSVEGETQ